MYLPHFIIEKQTKIQPHKLAIPHGTLKSQKSIEITLKHEKFKFIDSNPAIKKINKHKYRSKFIKLHSIMSEKAGKFSEAKKQAHH